MQSATIEVEWTIEPPSASGEVRIAVEADAGRNRSDP
jgi:hypothetical protein